MDMKRNQVVAMMVFDQDEELLPWAANIIGIERFRDDARAIGRSIGGILRCVAVFDTFTASDCNMHIASDGGGHWLNREFLVHAFAYPFVTCNLRRVTAMVAASNHAALKFDRHLGFVDEGFHPQAMPDDDIHSLGMLRQNCRFIPPEHRHA